MFWDPFDEISRLHDEMNRIFNSFYGTKRHGNELVYKQDSKKELAKEEHFRTPVSNIYETENSVIANLELPGVDKKNIDLNVTDMHIEVKVDAKTEKEEKHKGIYRYESRSSQFYRAIPLPVEVDAEKTNAEYKDGVLRVEIPKLKTVDHKKKRIDIK